MDGMTLSLPWLLFAMGPDEREITTLGDEALVRPVPEDLVVLLRVVSGAEQGRGYQYPRDPADHRPRRRSAPYRSTTRA